MAVWFAVVLVLILLLVCTYFVLRRLVTRTSLRYRKLCHLASDMGGSLDARSTAQVTVRCDSLYRYQRFDAMEPFRLQVEERPDDWIRIVNGLCQRRDQYQRILSDFGFLSRSALHRGFPLVPYWAYHRMEVSLCDRFSFLGKDACFSVVWTYTSPAGRNHYQNQVSISLDHARRVIADVTQPVVGPAARHSGDGGNGLSRRSYDSDSSVNKYGVSKAFVRRERNKVTPKIRYQVMQRDSFRCVLCGRAAEDTSELRVDHIKPVSRGGLSTMDNLRTLCFACNAGKGDLWDPNGLN